MKFAGLILICASSCLALILPAVGLVKFPIRPATKRSITSAWNAGSLDQNQPVSSNFAQLNAPTQSNAGPSGFPVSSVPPAATSVFAQFPNNGSNASDQAGGGSHVSNFLPSGNAAAPTTGSALDLTNALDMPQLNPSQKISMGLWLSLLPVALLGLLMWTVAPDPNALRRK